MLFDADLLNFVQRGNVIGFPQNTLPISWPGIVDY